MNLPRRFVDKYRESATGCWEWVAGRSSLGYGKFSLSGRTVLAHRYAYSALVGPIPTDRQLDHLCRNRACVNPAHLEPVTASENVRRGDLPALVAGRNRSARDATQCGRGHPFDQVNTYVNNGKRCCKACKADRCRRYRNTTRSTRETTPA